MSKIEWTGKTWNPVVGCSRISAGCEHCYAEGQVHRGMIDRHKGLTVLPRDKDGKSLGKGARWTGEVRMVHEVLDVPLRRKKPTTWFVNSLSDLFHEKLVDSEEGRRFIAAIFGVMAATPQHTYQVLTKRPHKAREWFGWLDSHMDSGKSMAREVVMAQAWVSAQSADDPRARIRRDIDGPWPLPNVWIGASVENQEAADARIPELLQLPAAVRFLSCEPLLGQVNIRKWLMSGTNPGQCLNCENNHGFDRCPNYGGVAKVRESSYVGDPGCTDFRRGHSPIGWVIAGGESGPKARPMHPDWARSLRDQCVATGVPFFFKQWGEYIHRDPDGSPDDGGDCIRVGKKAAGRELDGRTWDQFPEAQP